MVKSNLKISFEYLGLSCGITGLLRKVSRSGIVKAFHAWLGVYEVVSRSLTMRDFSIDSLIALYILFILHLINSPYNFLIQKCPQNSNRVQFRFRFFKRRIIKHLKNLKLYSIEVYPSNYHRECSPDGFYSLFQFEGFDVISVLKIQ